MDKLHDATADEHLSKENSNKAEHQAIDDGEAITGDVEVLPEEEAMNVERLQDELAKQIAKAEEYYNRLLRLQADFDNYRKRTAKEKEEFIKYAAASLCEELLPVLDNFQLALAAKEQDPSKVVEGITMIIRQLQDILHKEGLTPVTSVGEQFDPTRHEAIMQEITDQYPENTVTAELRQGYYLKDKLLRPALVKVAKPGN
ncbi:heat shock protein GrpE [Sporotomaculum syntrophicum]|uniref:Protein GrpE n=1 Tax=Sporotomaculum syntrophicum TaxID=182264 RepID=A0A9D2WMU7_9FIRM|nr:nucleotide exchange factor GrpE [Sporotomaculum syntrophicum]KAF1084094.1 heat shock protein GrpE [Sporotomaculum syntrophicum]